MSFLPTTQMLPTVALWQRDLNDPSQGFCQIRSERVAFHFAEPCPDGGQPGPSQRRELNVEVATILIEIRDPSDFSKVFQNLHAGGEISIVLHAAFKSSLRHPATQKAPSYKRAAEAAYLKSYARAMAALKAVEAMIHDNPAPESGTDIGWGNVGDMDRIASELESILPEK